MGVELRKGSQWWYGNFEAAGKRRVVPLGVKVAGVPPASLLQDGDRAFERSRAKALAKLELLMEEAKSRATAERHLEKLYEIKAGEKLESIALADMPAAWAGLPGKRERSREYSRMGRSLLAKFATYIADHYGEGRYMSDVTSKMAKAYMASLRATGIAGRTWNSKLILLRSAFHRLAQDAGLTSNPFAGIPTRDEHTIHRKPFTEEELTAIIDLADDFTRPIIVTAVCTAMRRGDCCMLKWEDVDMEAGFVVVKTSKTGETAEIPLFPPLRVEIEKRRRNGSAFIFPEQAAMFRENHYGVTDRTLKVFRRAGIVTHEPREHGKQRASVKDFHSFRTTWITLALSAGVPMELVRRVTGHATVDIVLKHYFRPGRDDFRKSLEMHMPRVITGVNAPTVESRGDSLAKALRLLEGVNARNFSERVPEARNLLQQAVALSGQAQMG